MKILSAEYILPIADSPIKNGAVAIENDKIIAVGEKAEITEKFPEAIHEDFGNSAIMPGFINCHSHLELTAMRGFLDRFDDDFYSWLMKLTKTRTENLSIEDIKISAMFGALEGVKAGITCFGDIGRLGIAGFKALKENGLRGILFQETEFSPDDKTAEIDFEKLKEKFLALKDDETNLVKIGISPHAPYTVSRKLFEKITDYALRENIKITIHAAESEQEKNLMQNGEGFFAKLYREQEINWESPKCSTIEYLNNIGVLQAKPLLAHCVKVSENDIKLIAESQSKIAHCPKSNAKFGHGIAPLEKFLDANIVIGFGSDSMASNNICDILEEARFAALIARTRENKKRFIHAEEIIKTATIGGAKALNSDKEIGTLEAGKQADLIVISLEAVAQKPVHDIYTTLLFASGGKDVRLTMVAGEEIYRDGDSTKVDEKELAAKMKEIANKM
ncbi:MAG: amidohydrolase family protein [Aridibacter sp.]